MPLSATDQDQEVKECAISAMAATAARLGDCLQNEVGLVLPTCERGSRTAQ